MRLGSVVLASLLLGVPRALDARTFGAQRRHVELAPRVPELAGFALALERALAAVTRALTGRRRQPTLVVDLRCAASGVDARGRAIEAIALEVRDRCGMRRFVLHGNPADRLAGARRLLERLSPHES